MIRADAQAVEPFLAGPAFVGEACYLCGLKIQYNELVKFYGGPFLMHYDCIEKMLEREDL